MEQQASDKPMSGQAASIFRLVSIGTAKENKPRNSFTLNVLMNEKAMATNGEIKFDPKEVVREWQDQAGQTHQVKTTQERSMPCEWLPGEDNRATPPDVMRNELIEVWRLGDTDQYYWRSMALKNGLRALESVVYTWNASPNPGGGGIDFNTCYFMAVSAHDKNFTIGTSKANGEPNAWRMQFNTERSEFTLTDQNNQEFEIISAQKLLQLKNADGTFIKIEGQEITMSANAKITLICGGTTYTMTPDSIEEKTSTFSLTASSKATETSPDYTISSPKLTIGGGRITARAPGGFAIVG
uniref:Baseplate assembly protein n=1 Tax=Pseudomonas phage RVTF4 TaxID=3236931 RepID=A0AB39CDF4_9VIRU